MKMDCSQIEELMMDYLYQELDSTQTSAYRAHLTACATCSAQLAGYERTRHAVRLLPDMDPPAAVTARLLHEAAARRPVQAVEAVAAGAGAGRTVVAAGGDASKGIWAWLTGWMQPLMAHPGFAAVAGLVLIGGIAGFLVMSGKLDANAPATRSSAEAAEGTSGAGETQLLEAKSFEDGVVAMPPAAAAPVVSSPEPLPYVVADPGLDDGRYRRERDQAQLDRGAATGAQQPRAGRMASPAEEQNVGGYALGGEGRGGGGAAVGKAATRGDREGAEAPRAKDAEALGGVDSTRAQDGKADKSAPARSASKPTEPSVSQGAPGGSVSGAKSPPAAKKEQRPAAPAPPPPAANRGPAPTGGAGAAAGESFDDADEAEAAPPRDAPSVASSGSAPAEEKKKAKPNPKEAEARKLHGQARAKANTGDCTSALKLRDRIFRVDPTYFDRSVKNDTDLTRCSNQSKKPARKASDSESKSPAADEAPAAAPSK